MQVSEHDRQLLAYLLGKGRPTVAKIAKELGWDTEDVIQAATRLAVDGRVTTKKSLRGMTVVITDVGVATLTSQRP
jgi:DNA-binding Lrp family transcriptional regulator